MDLSIYTEPPDTFIIFDHFIPVSLFKHTNTAPFISSRKAGSVISYKHLIVICTLMASVATGLAVINHDSVSSFYNVADQTDLQSLISDDSLWTENSQTDTDIFSPHINVKTIIERIKVSSVYDYDHSSHSTVYHYALFEQQLTNGIQYLETAMHDMFISYIQSEYGVHVAYADSHETPEPFITTWTTTTANESITIPVGGAAGQYTVDWGDGSQETVTGNALHQYSDAGTYTVSISGDFTRIHLGDDSSNARKLQSIQQWGDIQWSSMNNAFAYASNMVYTATDVPDIFNVTDMQYMFRDASSFNSDLNSWNVSSVTDMQYMFRGTSSFNSDLSSWDVSGVTTMRSMFYDASSFNSDLSSWDVSGVTTMRSMFYDASSFNSDLSSWNVSGVTDMRSIFDGASSFNSDLSSWGVSGVTTMQYMFDDASSFNSDLSSWDVSGVTTMHSIFDGASSFNSDLSSWNVSGVTDMRSMFDGASSFNSDLSSWDVSGVTTMRSMFYDASSFNGDLSRWDVSAVTNMGSMFSRASSFNSDLSSWNVSSVTSMSNMFRDASSFNGDLSSWDVSAVTNMSNMLTSANAFDQNLGKWYIVLDDYSIDDGDTSRTVTSISVQNRVLGGQSAGYSIASSGDGDAFEIVGSDLKLKSVPNYAVKSSYTVTILSGGGFGTLNSETFDIFVYPTILPPASFITTWTTTTENESITIPVGGAAGQYTVDWGDGSQETVTGNALHQYSDAGTYTVSISGDFTRIHLGGDPSNAQKLQSIQQWGDIQWSSMNNAFAYASNMVYTATDVPILSDVSDMSGMFSRASSFNGDIVSWDVSGITDMSDMFLRASSFNSDLSSWDVSGVINMRSMFENAGSFNSDLSSWNVSGATDMSYLFSLANAFDGDISSWDVSGVTNMNGLFWGADAFDGDISSWNVSGVTEMDDMFHDNGAFDGDISSWNVSGVTTMGSMFLNSIFDGDISSWDVSGVTHMSNMFQNADSFNGNLSAWDISGVFSMQHMFYNASSFNGDISSWDVSGVTNMHNMLSDADSFDQNLGKWYIILDDYSIDDGDTDKTVTRISTQNTALGNHSPTYSIAPGGDGDAFEIAGSALKLKSVPNYAVKSSYTVTILSGGGFGTSNSETFDIFVYPTILPPASFITTWTTTTANESIKIPVGGATGQYTVDWGDGSRDTVTGNALHQYSDAGTYTVSISGDFTRINLGDDYSNARKLHSIQQWGDIRWSSMNSAFKYTSNMVYNATDVPILSDVNDMSGMFSQASSFDGDISSWNVSGVTDMHNMFYRVSSFNSDLSSWDVSGVTDMRNMFYFASSFNSDLSSWDVSGVTDMHKMFFFASSFNSDLSSWDVSAVTDIRDVFRRASSFNSDLSSWDVSGVTNTRGMFSGASSFTSDLSSWDVSGVTDMEFMFNGASSFNSDLSSWDVSDVTSIYYMFHGASSFNSDLNSWDVSGVTDMDYMFHGASSFNSDLSSWDVSGVTDMSNMFQYASSFNSDLSSWDVSGVTDMSNMFQYASSFNSDLSSWDVSGVTDMRNMFYFASSFNSDLSSWDVSGVTDMRNMFSGTDAFDRNLGKWYIVLDDYSIDDGDTDKTVARISTQNTALGNPSPTYSIASGGDGDAFEIAGSDLKLKSVPNYAVKSSYTVTILSGGGFGTSNSETFDIFVYPTILPPASFITTWTTTTENESITIPVGGAAGPIHR